jgi:cbb3-type cytochrome oxidase cytochrome c subunit/mono/diheme cytochrome c family protein
MALKKDPDHSTDVNRLNMFFALSSILMLITFVWMFWQDFNRDYKYYQAKFRNLDRTRTEEAKAQEIESLQENTAYQQLLSDIKAAETEKGQRQKDYQAVLAEQNVMQGKWYLDDENFRFKKAEYEAKRYDYEEAVAEHPDSVGKKKVGLDKTKKELDELSAKLDQTNGKKAEIDAKVDDFTKKIDDLEKTKVKLTTKLDRLKRKEKNIAPDFANIFRNLPMVDFIDPSIKIQQVVINNQFEDLNFTTVPRVDRCMSCHVPIDQDGWTVDTEVGGKKLQQPFLTHPRLDVFAGSNAKHPMESFGCTGCHMGRGRSTGFEMAAHTPGDEKQAEEWKEKYGWRELHSWDYPMYASSMVEASCIKCHTGVAMIPGGDKINTARTLFIEYGCHGCHLTRGFENLPKVGPDLRRVSSKVSMEWAMKWIDNPKAFKPTTRMPRYFHNSNNSSPEDVERTNTEIRAIAEYLFAKSDPTEFQYSTAGLTGNAEFGKQLLHDLGCVGCHLTSGETPASLTTRRHFGPPLEKIGSKTNAEWLFNWLKEPKNYSPLTRMPNMKLSDQEAIDVTAYLLSLRDPEWESKAAPAASEKWLHEEITYYLKRVYGLQAEAEYNKMSEQQRYEFLGEKALSRYGCSGCHRINGFETAKGIGTSLSEEGSKRISKFDFGFVNLEHTVPAYITQKLHDPRSFDVIPEGKEQLQRVKRWDEKLIMPNFGFSDDEIQNLVMLVLGETKEIVPMEAQRVLTDREQIVEKGKWLVVQRNCVACHSIDGWGGEIRNLIQEQGMAPPALIAEGEKVQSDWLFQFLKNPGRIRPWLKVRMPNFRFTDEEANTLVQYFMASTSTGTFDSTPDIHENLADGQQLFTTFQCATCHLVGSKIPEGKTAAELAPNLTMASSRLRPEWILKWLDDPQKYQPGTRMPDFFPEAALPTVLGGDPEKQKASIRNYLFSIGQGPQTSILTPLEFAGPSHALTAQSGDGATNTGTGKK